MRTIHSSLHRTQEQSIHHRGLRGLGAALQHGLDSMGVTGHEAQRLLAVDRLSLAQHFCRSRQLVGRRVLGHAKRRRHPRRHQLSCHALVGKKHGLFHKRRRRGTTAHIDALRHALVVKDRMDLA